MKRILGMLACAAALGLAAPPANSQTLATVKARGVLNCGSNPGLAGFGLPDAQGNWTGFDVDFCRAVAAAIFDDAKKVKFVPLTAKDRFTALQSGEVDVLARNTTWTSSRDTALGLNFTGVTYYDGQGAQGARRQIGAGAERSVGLRRPGHHDRTQPRGLFPRQQDAAEDRDVRDQ
jgi:general L-amino acid transport system substrate-binding protein